MGVRFHPTDEELIGHYLYLKNNPNSVTASTFVPPEFDLYGETEPWIIWEAYGGPRLKHQDLFFFTRLKKKANTRIIRKIGSSGTWSQGEPSKPIFDKDTPIGRKTKLRYENKLVPEQHGCWYMEEYTSLHAAAQHDYVICRFRESRNRSSSSSSGAGAIRNCDNKRKYHYDDNDDHSKPTKKQKSLRVAATTTTTNEEQQQFDAVEMFHPHELFRNDDDQMAQPFSQHQVQVEDDQENDAFLSSLDQWLNTDDPIDNDSQYQFSDSDVEAFLADSSISGLF